MPYPEIMIRPMREDLTRLGVEELRTADAVDETIRNSKGTLMVVVNSICGCAAGKARPGVALALQNEIKPILDSTNETISTMRGTVTFLSDNLAEPVVKLNETFAAVNEFRRFFRFFRGK